MVKKTGEYQWEVTLADDSIVKESETGKFDLAWEKEGSVKNIALKQVDGDKSYSVNLETGEFDINGKKDNPSPGSLGDFGLIYFKRNIVRVDQGGGQIASKIIYFIGYKKGNDEKLLKVSPFEEAAEYSER